jgi:hypothetical protein
MGQEKCLGQELLAQHCSHFGCLNPQFYQEKHGKTVDYCKTICKKKEKRNCLPLIVCNTID